MIDPLLLALAAAVGPPPDPALTTAQEPPPTVVCEAPAGHYDILQLVGVEKVLSGRIRLDETKDHPKWAPVAGLLFVLPGKKRRAGVQVFVDFDHRDVLTIGIVTPKTRGRPIPLARVPLADPVGVRASMDGKGNLTVTAAGTSKTVRVANAGILARIVMCSSGRFTFENVPLVKS